ncbi:MAG: type II toxin-antitoxin system RelE/ParE family toxin [Dehalococcoidia bacterium]|nr:type II toxin-antitoxin system RelE/ParE family toxin [Dehalococcoidia bacterium]
MTWRVAWTEAALRDLRKLDKTVVARVIQAVERLAEKEHGNVRRLHGLEREWRLRVGEWRVRFTYEDQAGELVVLRVLPRSRAYQR